MVEVLGTGENVEQQICPRLHFAQSCEVADRTVALSVWLVFMTTRADRLVGVKSVGCPLARS